MHNRLLNLYARNAKRGEFRVNGNMIYLDDVIVGSELEAEFWGGVSPQGFRRTLEGMSGDVTLRINSPGGDVFAARAMAQAMREYEGAINVIVDGLAASAASLIAVSASSLRMAPGSMLMIHKAWSIAMGNSDDFMDIAGLLEKIDGTIAETYASKGKGDEEHYMSLMAAETWFTAQEAVEEGLADEAISEGPKAKSNWDLSAFLNAPAQNQDDQVKPDLSNQIRARRLAAALV